MSFAFDRATFRIQYPRHCRPRFHIDGLELEVVDCSEEGIRYVAPAGRPLPNAGDRVAGELRLVSAAPRDRHPVEGTVLRCLRNEVCVELDKPGIPMSAVFAEQRWLARRFPARFL